MCHSHDVPYVFMVGLRPYFNFSPLIRQDMSIRRVALSGRRSGRRKSSQVPDSLFIIHVESRTIKAGVSRNPVLRRSPIEALPGTEICSDNPAPIGMLRTHLMRACRSPPVATDGRTPQGFSTGGGIVSARRLRQAHQGTAADAPRPGPSRTALSSRRCWPASHMRNVGSVAKRIT